MKTGSTLQQLIQQITAENAMKKDYLADTRKIRMTPEGAIRAQLGSNGSTELVDFKPNEVAIRQIGERANIPAKYVDRMAAEAPELLAINVNHWFDKDPDVRMMRTFRNGTNVLRGFLSKSYRRRDNAELAQFIMPKLAQGEFEVKSSAITETRLYLQCVTPKLEGLIQARKAEAPGEHRINAINDVVQAGIVISNSEVGFGRIKIEPMVFRLVCRNGLIVPDMSFGACHVGKNTSEEGQEATEMYRDETVEQDDKAFWMKVADVVDHVVLKEKWDQVVDRMNKAAGVEIGKPTEAVELTQKRFNIQESEGESILEHLARGGDLSQWGLVNAITRTAEDVKGYDRAIELERIGGQLLYSDWATLRN